MSDRERYVTLARLVRPHGLQGEVAAEILTDFPEHLPKLKEAFLVDSGDAGARRRVAVRNCRVSESRGGQAIFHFAGCDSVDSAEKLRGMEVQIPIEQRVNLPAGSYFVTDLVGCEVFEAGEDGKPAARLGVVADVQFPGEDVKGTPVLVVATDSGELLVPLAEDICRRVDTTGRRIDVALPQGLGDLNS